MENKKDKIIDSKKIFLKYQNYSDCSWWTIIILKITKNINANKLILTKIGFKIPHN